LILIFRDVNVKALETAAHLNVKIFEQLPAGIQITEFEHRVSSRLEHFDIILVL